MSRKILGLGPLLAVLQLDLGANRIVLWYENQPGRCCEQDANLQIRDYSRELISEKMSED